MLISVHEKSSQCCMGAIFFQLLCMKSQNPAFSEKYHKVNEILLQELLSKGLRIWLANQGPKYKQKNSIESLKSCPLKTSHTMKQTISQLLNTVASMYSLYFFLKKITLLYFSLSLQMRNGSVFNLWNHLLKSMAKTPID